MRTYKLLRLRYDEVDTVLETWAGTGWVVEQVTTSGEIVTLLLGAKR